MRNNLLLAVLISVLSATGSAAGPNAGGTLIVALAEGVVYSSADEPYCGASTATDCESAVVEVLDPGIHVLHVIAAFAKAAVPRLAGVTFGVDYNQTDGVEGVSIFSWGLCGDFELPDPGWPDPGTGVAVTWGAAQTSVVNEVYWFATYAYYGDPEQLCLIPSPTQGADFADDTIPAILDPIAELGCFGFFSPGLRPCPSEDVLGACCFSDSSCEVFLEAECLNLGGTFFGPPGCEPDPCPPPGIGACCFGDDCLIRTEEQCGLAGGAYKGDDVPCEPNPCIPTPSIDVTWGWIKGLHR